MKLRLFMFVLLATSCLFAQDPFRAKTTFNEENELPLTVHSGNNLQTFQAKINGVPCTMLFDTGASHTTFDRGFIEKNFPTLKLYPIQITADSNVQTSPSAFQVSTFTLGEAELTDFYAMTLPLNHLGIKVDGILGMNTMAYAPFILDIGNQKVTWLAPGESMPKDATALPTLWLARNTLRLLATFSNETLPVLIDSGSSYTFFHQSWWKPATEEDKVAMQTSDVNERAQKAFTKGVPGELKTGMYTWALTPFISSEPGAVLGADALMKVKLFIDAENKSVGVLP